MMTGSAVVGIQREEQRGKDAAWRGTGADGPGVRDILFQLHVLPVRQKSVIHLQVESGTLSW